VVRTWWQIEPLANVGLVTGHEFDVLDIDGEDGMAALIQAMPADGETIDGPTVCTGRGWHVYVQPTGLGNRAGVVEHCDWRGAGGYVVAPPSVHPSGARYEWYHGADDPDFGADAPLWPAPAWLLSLLCREVPVTSTTPTARPAGRTSAYGQRALVAEAGKVALAPPGQRNSALNAAAYNCGRLVAGGELDIHEVVDQLLLAADRCGLPESEARRTIASGLEAGFARPRRTA
jgi:hypothetical protein